LVIALNRLAGIGIAGLAGIILPASALLHAAAPTAGASAAVSEGIWKAVVPPNRMRGEFDNMDVLGLAVGAKIPSDCSLNWTNPDDGKLYCFVSGTSLVVFLEHPHANIDSARGYWATLAESRK
jgi:hypothetical protein